MLTHTQFGFHPNPISNLIPKSAENLSQILQIQFIYSPQATLFFILGNIYFALLVCIGEEIVKTKVLRKKIYASSKLKTGYGFSLTLFLLLLLSIVMCAQHSKRVLSHRGAVNKPILPSLSSF